MVREIMRMFFESTIENALDSFGHVQMNTLSPRGGNFAYNSMANQLMRKAKQRLGIFQGRRNNSCPFRFFDAFEERIRLYASRSLEQTEGE